MMPTRFTQGARGTYCYSALSHAALACLIVVVTPLVMATAGCAEQLASIRLPSRAVTTPAAGSTPPATTMSSAISPRQQALATLAGYMTALGEAEDSRSGVVAHGLLTPYLVANRVDGLVRAMTAIWARGDSFEGQEIRHVSNVTIVGHYAFVHECDNTSGMVLVDIATRQIVPGSSGTSRANLVTRLDLVAGHWLVQFQLFEDVPCAV